jgi:hypothetical protein
LAADRDKKISILLGDKLQEQENLQIAMDEIEKRVEEEVSDKPECQSDEDLREIVSKQIRLQQQAKAFMEKPDWIDQLKHI